MKKRIIFAVALIVLTIVAIAIPRDTYQKLFNKKEKDPVNETIDTYQVLYLENEKGLLVGKKVKVAKLAEDQVMQKWNLLTKDAVALPDGYKSSLATTTELIDYEVNNDTLILNVTEDVTSSNGRKALEAIAWTFSDNQIKNIVLQVNGIKISQIGDYKFTQISKEKGINFDYETVYLYEANATTVVFHKNDELLPVTYFHLENDICNYIIAKTLDNNIAEVTSLFNYTILEDAIEINFIEDSLLSNEAIQTITESIELNFEVSKLTINDVDSVILETVFGEITENGTNS